ncbi:MAG: alpha-hydroxy-acid oxidizing protein [Rhodospirillales bacterium]|jgi:isopentenyl diphosphate isomerase/L-lactate dehydrogenase-like FMN-dependent dehydrogenase|nr:hypothetical protein [Rhodospirillaceae bacterium]MDP6429528.1 alpha-hydroxy-acid oxidizing protein [Rhodospirillales bacterium]MDP6646333.1 alpha-hydroxy-acid oxidizing protein [Rhodospirillales bacterium]MDP6842686.1 alpha-hydroxy-acid oxidizing protein [Rhodospirillales bacterium]|tara:strand:- start:1390 stop:1581 length:192 start_codon:yes stop_codon:yes gene_type:complete
MSAAAPRPKPASGATARPRAKIIIDGGFTRGTDILKAMCLGADAVGIGRSTATNKRAGLPAGG